MRNRLLVLVLGAATAVFVGCIELLSRGLGVGHFRHEIVFENTAPVRSAKYCCGAFDTDERRRIEREVKAGHFALDDAVPRAANAFEAHVMFTNEFSLLRPTRVHHYPHMVLIAEFADGTSVCKVVDIPDGQGEKPLRLQLRQN